MPNETGAAPQRGFVSMVAGRVRRAFRGIRRGVRRLFSSPIPDNLF